MHLSPRPPGELGGIAPARMDHSRVRWSPTHPRRARASVKSGIGSSLTGCDWHNAPIPRCDRVRVRVRIRVRIRVRVRPIYIGCDRARTSAFICGISTFG